MWALHAAYYSSVTDAYKLLKYYILHCFVLSAVRVQLTISYTLQCLDGKPEEGSAHLPPLLMSMYRFKA